MPHSRHSGFTYLETLLVVTIVAVIAGSSASFFSNSIQSNNLKNSVDMIITTFRKAQFYSISGKRNSSWGCCLIGNSIRLFIGSCASPDFSEDFTLPANISVSAFTPVTFSLGRGEPSSSVSITVSSSTESQTLNLNSIGGLAIN